MTKFVRDNPFEDLINPADESAPAEIDAAAERVNVALFEATRDRSCVSARRVLGREFEQYLDELHTPKGSAYFSEAHASRAEQEEKRREELILLGAIAGHVSRGLKEHGIRVVKVIPAAEEPGGGEYICKCRDSAGREYTARFGWELSERLVATGGETNIVERMGHAVARSIVEERDRYFARMNGAAT